MRWCRKSTLIYIDWWLIYYLIAQVGCSAAVELDLKQVFVASSPGLFELLFDGQILNRLTSW